MGYCRAKRDFTAKGKKEHEGGTKKFPFFFVRFLVAFVLFVVK
jgi:hypothetical protein